MTVDIIGGQTASLKGTLKAISTDVQEAEGAFGKLKAAGSGAFDFVEKNAGAFALGAGTALVGFGIKAVGAMQDVSLGAGKLRDALGLTAEQASRWQEVAGDLGISNGTLSTVIGKMNQTLGKSPALFQSLGIEVVKTKTGATDVSATFLNVIDALNKIRDPAVRAAEAQKILGKSWKDSAELISLGADQVKARLVDVEGQKIVSDDQIAQSRKLRDAMDNLHDSAEDVTLTVGNALIPELTNLATTAGQVAGPLAKVVAEMTKIDAKSHDGSFWDGVVGSAKTAVESAGNPFAPVMDAWGELQSYLDDNNSGNKAAADHLNELGAGTDDVNKRFQNLVWTTNQAAVAGKAQADAQEAQRQSFVDTAAALKTWADNQADALQEAEAFKTATAGADWGAASLKGATTAMDDYTTSLFAAGNNTQAQSEAWKTFTASIHDNGISFDVNTEKGAKNQDALQGLASTLNDDLAQAYIDAGGSSDAFKAKGAAIESFMRNQLAKTFGDNKGKIDEVISALGLMPGQIETRYKLSGDEEAKLKLQLLQSAIDHLPKDVEAIVRQRVLAGDYQGAVQAIQNYNDAHPTTVRVNAVVGSTTAASSVLAQTRTPQRAGGGTVGANEPFTVVGEKGPEIVSLPAGSRVHTATESAAALAAGGGNTYNVSFVASGDVARDFAAYERWQWRQNAQPRRKAS